MIYWGKTHYPKIPASNGPPNGVNISVSRAYGTPTPRIVGGAYNELIPVSHIGCKFAMTLTRQEVSQHNSRQSCWVVIHGAVYDVTGEVLSSVEFPKLTP